MQERLPSYLYHMHHARRAARSKDSFRYRLHECLFNVLVHGLANAFSHFNTTVNGKMPWVIMYDPSKVVNSAPVHYFTTLEQRFANLCFDYSVEISR